MKKLKCTMKPEDLREGDMFWYEFEDDLRVFDGISFEGYSNHLINTWNILCSTNAKKCDTEHLFYMSEYEFIGNIKEA